ncbi:MAG: sigma-70 family RNA polymerase sigma factor, partial [Candidatus Nealsonbacteria bacterium]|nr:sigma-70 family RNA polymerase sigma factor [Candidatus Nealsonbacteria bacterium]
MANNCLCKDGLFDCEDAVRRYLAGDFVALEELIERMTRLIELVVYKVIQGRNQQHKREDAIQDTFVKICDRKKLRTWWEGRGKQRRSFCKWLSVVTHNCAVDQLKPPPPPPHPPEPIRPYTRPELEDLAERLIECMLSVLKEYPFDWQLTFLMKYSYLNPTIPEIAAHVKKVETAVHYRKRAILRRIREQSGSLFSPYLAEVKLEGTRHPADGFEHLAPEQQDGTNQRINRLLLDYDLKQQLAFYMRFSPLAPSADRGDVPSI